MKTEEPKITIESTRLERIEIIRMGPGSDLLEGLNQA